MNKRKSKWAPDHPVVPPCGTTHLSRIILYDAIGEGPHKCHWCNTPVYWTTTYQGHDALIVDHIDGDYTNDDLSNLVPSCNTCNNNRTRTGKIKSTDLVVLEGYKTRRAVELTCTQCSTKYLVVTKRASISKFCSKLCKYDSQKGKAWGWGIPE